MLEVKELQYFVVCADLSSFSRAAEVLYTTQPNVSKVIRSLEEKLGFEVFERDNRGIKLTRRGRQAYEYAGKILEQERQLAQIYKIDDRNSAYQAIPVRGWHGALQIITSNILMRMSDII